MSKKCFVNLISAFELEIFNNCEKRTHAVEEEIESLFATIEIANAEGQHEMEIANQSMTNKLVAFMLL